MCVHKNYLKLLFVVVTLISNFSLFAQSPPDAVISANKTRCEAQCTITFSAVGTTDSDNDIISYVWNFGDNNHAYGYTATHTFYDSGVYEVVLVVFDMTGQADQATIKIVVTEPCGIYQKTSFSTKTGICRQPNFGSTSDESIIKIHAGQDGYLKFDLRDIPDEIENMELELHHEGFGQIAGDLRVYIGDCLMHYSPIPRNPLASVELDNFYSLEPIRINLGLIEEEQFTLRLETNSEEDIILGGSEYYFEDGRPRLNLIIDNSDCDDRYYLPIYLEAECAIIGGNWQVKNQQSASNNQTLLYPGSLQEFLTPPTQMNKIVRFPIFLSSPATYDVALRILVNSNPNNSFWVRANNGNWFMFSDIPRKAIYQWKHVYDNNNDGQTMTINFHTGYNFIDVAVMEDGVKLDKIALLPVGRPLPNAKGPMASNCQDSNSNEDNEATKMATIAREQLELSDEIVNQATQTASSSIETYPNPFSDHITLDMNLDSKTVDIHLYNARGQLVATHKQVDPAMPFDFGSELLQGIYFVHIQDGEQSFHQKILKVLH